MLDSEILTQLRQLFANLPTDIALVLAPSAHPLQGELRALAEAVASASPRLRVRETGNPSPVPRLELVRDQRPLGVSFRGVPGGHEFSSLVLAILHANGQGRMPDAALTARVRALRGPIRLRTIVSLECSNCPEVVQALNLMAILHPDFQHEMWDGALHPEEVERLGVQGVPAVFAGDQLVHVGKADLGELLTRLEALYGSAPLAASAVVREADIAIAGGGPAGVAAAIYSVRKGLRTVLVASRIGGQVRDTLGIENLISVPYTEGPRLAENLRSHLQHSGVEVLDGRTVERVLDGERKELQLAGGERVLAGQLIIATGASWRRLGVPGEQEHLGRGVAFCPHCDGPFFKDKRVAVIGGGNSGVEAAIDLAGICRQVTLLEFAEQLRADAVLQRKLRSLPNVAVHTQARTTAIVGDGARVQAIRWEDRATKAQHELELEGVFVQIGLAPNSACVKDLVELNRAGEIVVDDRGRTSRPGIYAAGDVTNRPFKQIVIAIGDGARTALAAFEDRMRQG
ncbi:MAG: alkyl hydroperoxide reductase subunit F [Planctomycetota bacterium]|nr:alkyl hydroperoxide reductase subunit F [Planctomycetota bacterium]MCX8039930.1 alkyl hydroperoxide reductase subunit F [Planctomycetota bacterium]MDW8373697.1 alkyl hydroperoxide reductase subunit F [Planctomycetota bacterium]